MGRFGWNEDPAVDFCVEVDVIEGEVEDIKAGLRPRKEVEDRMFKALMFRVGGDANAVSARRKLLQLEQVVTQL